MLFRESPTLNWLFATTEKLTMNILYRILVAAGAAGPVVLKFIPGALGTAIGATMVGLGLLGAALHPSPAAVKAFGSAAK